MKTSGFTSHDDFFFEYMHLPPRIFGCLRAVHLCRPTNPASYLERGLIAMDAETMQQDAIAFFTSTHPEISEEDVREAIAKVPTQYRDSRVSFGIDERELMSNCGQYAVYGSEYLLAIAVKIVGDGKTDYRQTLRQRGHPSAVVAELPFGLVPEQTCKELSEDLLKAALWSHQLDKSVSPLNAFGFAVEHDVPASFIKDIIDAGQAQDPYERCI